MRWILVALAILAFLSGITVFAAAKSAIHEIEASILLVIAAVLFSGAAIVDAIHTMRRRFEALEELASRQ